MMVVLMMVAMVVVMLVGVLTVSRGGNGVG